MIAPDTEAQEGLVCETSENLALGISELLVLGVMISASGNIVLTWEGWESLRSCETPFGDAKERCNKQEGIFLNVSRILTA